MNAPQTQHLVNGAVALATPIAVLAQLPTIISALVGLCALFYYYLVIGKELRARKDEKTQIKQSTARVVETIHEPVGPAT